MKKCIAIPAVILIVTLMLSACGQTPSSQTPQTAQPAQSTASAASTAPTAPAREISLTAMTNLVDQNAKILEDMLNAYTQANPNVKIDFSAPGQEYGTMMKVKMASKDMPDLFSTHGWAKTLYGNFCADLKDRAWAKNIDPAFKPIISDASGKVYTLAFDEDKSGPVYNADVFQKYGISVPSTYDEFVAACDAIKTKSNGNIVPITCSAEDWEEAQFFDFFGGALLISPQENSAQQLLDGTFDWNKWTVLAQDWQDLYKKGYINKDMLTAKYDDNAKSFAEGKAAIGLYGPYFIDEAKKYNPDIKADLMPIPSMVSGDTPTFAGGEKSTLAVWNGSKELDTALQVIDFCAQPDNVTKMCEFTKLQPAFVGVNADIGEMTANYDKYKDIRTLDYLDRVYLPNGMWDVMCKNSQMIVAGKITAQQFSDDMKKEYLRLRTAQAQQ